MVVRVDDDTDGAVVLRRGAQHRRAADVDHLDDVRVGGAGGDRPLERVEVDDDEVDRVDAELGELSDVGGVRRSARIPAWTLGCSVLTRPPRHSGKPVRSATSTTSTPAARIVAAVEPVETMRTPLAASAAASSGTPVLSKQLMSALRTGVGQVRRGPSQAPVVHRRRGPVIVCQRIARAARRRRGRVRGRAGRRPREQPVLDGRGGARAGLARVIGLDVDGLLREDRPVVDELVDEVDRHPGDEHTGGERVPDRVRAAERGQQRGWTLTTRSGQRARNAPLRMRMNPASTTSRRRAPATSSASRASQPSRSARSKGTSRSGDRARRPRESGRVGHVADDDGESAATSPRSTASASATRLLPAPETRTATRGGRSRDVNRGASDQRPAPPRRA
jgi:hypothetical protein